MTSSLCWALCSACSPCDALGAGNPEASHLPPADRRLGCCALLPLRPSSTDPAVVGVADAVVNEMMAPRCDEYGEEWCITRMIEVPMPAGISTIVVSIPAPKPCPGGRCSVDVHFPRASFCCAPRPFCPLLYLRDFRRPRCLKGPCRACRPRGWRRHRKGRYNRPMRALPWACSS